MIYPQPFEDLWAVYPKRSPNNNKRDAYKQYTARLKQKHSHSDMIDGVRRYGECMEKMGNIGSPYVMCAKTFLGASEHFMEEWTPPKPEIKETLEQKAKRLGIVAQPGWSWEEFERKVNQTR